MVKLYRLSEKLFIGRFLKFLVLDVFRSVNRFLRYLFEVMSLLVYGILSESTVNFNHIADFCRIGSRMAVYIKD